MPRIELVIFGESLFPKNRILFDKVDISTTQLAIRSKGRYAVIKLIDPTGKQTPISANYYQGLLFGINMKFSSDEDRQRWNDSKRERNKPISISLTILDSRVFLGQLEVIKELTLERERLTQKFAEDIERKEKEFDRRMRAIQDPYERLLEEKNEKVRALTNKLYLATLRFEEIIIKNVDNAINDEMRARGVSDLKEGEDRSKSEIKEKSESK
jgi:hypothetical protein